MAEPKLTEILKEANTLREAFDAMKGMELMITRDFGSSYTPVATSAEFVILEECNCGRKQLLHPFGANIAYTVYGLDARRP
jgi:hypothetical protein